MLLRCYIQYFSKFGKLSSGHKTGKCQFSFQSQRRAMPKNVQTTAKLHSFHDSKVMVKILQVRLQQYMNQELPDAQARFRKGRGTRDKLPTSVGSQKKQENSRKVIYFSFIACSKAFVWITTNYAKFLKRWEYQTILSAS